MDPEDPSIYYVTSIAKKEYFLEKYHDAEEELLFDMPGKKVCLCQQQPLLICHMRQIVPLRNHIQGSLFS